MNKPTSRGYGSLYRKLLPALRAVSLRMHVINMCSMALAVVLAIVTIANLVMIRDTQHQTDQMNKNYQLCQEAVEELQDTSDLLTSEARQFVSSGKTEHLNRYMNEIERYDHRGHALKTLREKTTNADATKALEEARQLSDELAQTELYALRLTIASKGLGNTHQMLMSTKLTEEDAALSREDKQIKAYDLVYGNEYASMKIRINNCVHTSSAILLETIRTDLNDNAQRISFLLRSTFICVVLLLLTMAFVISSTAFLLLLPIELYEKNIREDRPLDPFGAQELRHLTAAYNLMYERNQDRAELLAFEAHNDALTGVLNRGAFNSMLTQHKANTALILVDVDLFKNFNDDYGHDMGDAILVEVSATLYSSFRNTDFVFRIGGDEFAVIVTNMHPMLRGVIARKLDDIAAFLRDTENGLPAATVSVGVAFGRATMTDDEFFNEADAALYEAKRRGRNCYVFADELDGLGERE